MSDHEFNGALVTMNVELEHLRARVSDLERERSNAPAPQLPDTLLLSDDFVKRAFAVWGHNLVAGFIVAISFWSIFFLIGVVASAY